MTTDVDAALARLRGDLRHSNGYTVLRPCVWGDDLATALAEIDRLREEVGTRAATIDRLQREVARVRAEGLVAAEKAQAAGYGAGQMAMREQIAADQDCGGPPLCVQPQHDGQCIRTYGGECPHQTAQEIRDMPILPEPQP